MKKVSPKSLQVLKGILDYLSENGEENLLPEVTKSLEKEVSKNQKLNEIVVTSVVKLTPKQLQSVRSILQKKFKMKMPIINGVDKNLLGGFTVKVNDWFLDASLSSQLQEFQRALLAN